MKNVFLITKDGIRPDDTLIGWINERFKVVEKQNVPDTEGILVVGGDGTMLHAVQEHSGWGKPFFGLNRGTVGFLMSDPTEEALDQIAQGEVEVIRPKLLQAVLYGQNGESLGMLTPFNDFYVERTGEETAKIRVTIDGKVRFDPLISDGIIVCAPAGSTAYNAAAGGQVLPLDSRTMVLTGICPMMFHHWRSSILSESTVVILEALETDKRPVRFLADGVKTPVSTKVAKAVVRMSGAEVQIGFAASQNFREKVLNLQLGQN